MLKVKHVGFQLKPNRDIDMRCINILDNLPNGETACSYIRKAMIYYYESFYKQKLFYDNKRNKNEDSDDVYGYIYILHSRTVDDVYKIGDTRNVLKRMPALKNYGAQIFGCDMNWEFATAFRYNRKLYPSQHIENGLKDIFSEYAVNKSECYQGIPLERVFKFLDIFQGTLIDNLEFCQ